MVVVLVVVPFGEVGVPVWAKTIAGIIIPRIKIENLKLFLNIIFEKFPCLHELLEATFVALPYNQKKVPVWRFLCWQIVF